MASTPVDLLVEIGEQRGLADLGHANFLYGNSECDGVWRGHYTRKRLFQERERGAA
jgi:hypothetical protein